MAHRSEVRTVNCDPDTGLRVVNDAGQVEVKGWDQDSVELRVECHAADEADLAKIMIDFGGGAGDVRAGYSTAEPLVDAWVDFRLRAPRMAALDLRSAAGEILVSGFDRSSRVATTSGTIRAARMSGTSTLTSASGPIVGAALEGTVFARSASGDVSLHGNLAGSHRVETASGDIQVDGVDGSIDARSASGNLDVTGRLSGRCSLRTVSGGIRVLLLPGSEVAVQSTAVRQTLVEARGPGILVIETASGEIELRQQD